jgi:hypothetical protein
MTNSENLLSRWQRYSETLARTNALNKAIVFQTLEAAGITHVAIGFDGEGDSGQIDGAAAFMDDQAVEFPAVSVTLNYAQSGDGAVRTHDVTLREGVEELCYGYLEQEYGGWENNDGAFGEFRFHIAERRIDLDFNGRFTDYSHTSNAF